MCKVFSYTLYQFNPSKTSNSNSSKLKATADDRVKGVKIKQILFDRVGNIVGEGFFPFVMLFLKSFIGF